MWKKIRCREEYFIFIIGFVIISECKVKGCCGEKVVVYVSILIFLIYMYMYLYVYIIIILFIIIIFICIVCLDRYVVFLMWNWIFCFF